MKRLTSTALVLAATWAFAAETPLPRFENKIESTPQSLHEGAQRDLTVGKLGPAWSGPPTPLIVRSRPPELKRVSRMPVIEPKVDAHLRVITPNESIDYALIVRSPDVESVE